MVSGSCVVIVVVGTIEVKQKKKVLIQLSDMVSIIRLKRDAETIKRVSKGLSFNPVGLDTYAATAGTS